MNTKNLVLPVILIMVIIASVTVIVYFSEIQIQKIKQITIDRRNSDVDNLSQVLSDRLEEAISDINISSQLPQVNSMPYVDSINPTLHGIPQDVDLSKRMIANNMLKNEKIFETIRFLLPNGDMYMLEPYSDQLTIKQNNFAFRDYYKGVTITHKPYLSEVFKSQATGNYVSVIAAPVFSKNGTMIGIWGGAMNLKSIQDYAKNHFLGKTGLIGILDQYGNVVATSSGITLQNTTLKDLEVYKKAQNGEIGSDIETIEGTKMYVSYSPILTSSSTWVLIVIKPYDDAFLAYETAKNQLYLMIIGVVIIVTVFGLYSRRTINSTNRLSKKLNDTNEELIRIDKEKGEFAAMVTHDLRNPVMVIKNYSNLLLDSDTYGQLNEKQRKSIEAISRGGDDLESLISDVLDAHTLSMKKLKLKKEKIDIIDLINQHMDEFESLAMKKGISIKSEIKSKGTVLCDPKRISQVIYNLVKNSMDFVPEKEGKITIRVEKGEGSSAIFTVEDNGKGIPTEHVEDLFKKFYQIDMTTPRKFGGTGLGLSICVGIVEAHGGKIWLDTSYTSGASFKFMLPESELE